MSKSERHYATVGRLHYARMIAESIASTLRDQADTIDDDDPPEIREYVIDDVESTIYKIDRYLRPLLVELKDAMRARVGHPRKRNTSMSSRWKNKGIADIADYIDAEDVRWWIWGWTDGIGLSGDATEPEGENASDENVLAYREGKMAGERERDKIVESFRAEGNADGE